MKKLAALIGVALLTLGAGGSVLAHTLRDHPHKSPVVAAKTETVTIEIPEVSCAACTLAARKAVKSVGGVVQLDEGDTKNRLIVTYEPAPGRPDAYMEALQKAGFEKAHLVGQR